MKTTKLEDTVWACTIGAGEFGTFSQARVERSFGRGLTDDEVKMARQLWADNVQAAGEEGVTDDDY